jgi:3-oxoacyl-[acyl-carrier protein] reductase
MDLTGKVALVTGASRGIGQAAALAMAQCGADVCVHYGTYAAGAEEVRRAILDCGRRAISVQGDVTKSADVERLVAETLHAFGQIDVLVNNAGITEPEPVFQTTKEKWDRMIEVNLTSVFLCCKAVLGHMVERREGCIINISSVCGKNGELGAGVHYCAAKAGVLGLTKALADQLGPYGIRVNAIAPAMIETRMIKWRPRDLMQATINKIPSGRLGTVEEMGALIAFLASSDAGFVSGSTVDINGGLYMD